MTPKHAGSPVFIIGAPRSGTSVLAWALAQHAQFGTSQEAEFNYHLFGDGHLGRVFRRSSRRSDGFLARHGVDYAAFCAALGTGIDALYRRHIPSPRWIDATPRNSLIAPQLARAFPSARFVHIIRDGRAVVRSLGASGFATWSARSFTIGCWTWRRFVNHSQAFARRSPERIVEIRYESLLAEPETTWERIFEFLAVEPSPACQRFVAEHRINSSFADGQANASASPSDWSRLQQGIFEALCGQTMRRLGYER